MTATLTDAPPQGRQVWEHVRVPVVSARGWSRVEQLDGLRELERIERELTAAKASVVSAMGDGRDTEAALARTTRSGRRQARQLVKLARVIEALPQAGTALANGEVSPAHVAALGPVAALPGAAELVERAAGEDADQFERTVRRLQLTHDTDLTARQKAARSLTFHPAEHGCVGIRGVFTPLEGELIRSHLANIADQRWRAAHPDRADTLDPEAAATLPQRLADAFLSLFTGTAPASAKPTVVVVVDAETLQAEMAGEGPVSFTEAAAWADTAELYAAIRATRTGRLDLGRNRRLASALQRLALLVRDGGHCVYPGCQTHWRYTQAHHLTHDTHGGPTNLHNLANLCPKHHHHLHLNHQTLARQPNGTYTVTNHDGTPLDSG